MSNIMLFDSLGLVYIWDSSCTFVPLLAEFINKLDQND